SVRSRESLSQIQDTRTAKHTRRVLALIATSRYDLPQPLRAGLVVPAEHSSDDVDLRHDLLHEGGATQLREHLRFGVRVLVLLAALMRDDHQVHVEVTEPADD